ncbi:MAG TPA: rhodanese-like domain-containing protein [Pyrinomonadaceae bacterium]|jgi:glyoxylase-like metal-dependent hydrolase (beta-lactamase superfamily II)/rhodanese-related sulfurtransferase|nr:rhodanese-like domain-containing protein [Pyrinomonadaceae bacterium]
MYFKQFYLGCLAHASYLIGSEGEAAVVDPQRDVDEYLAEAAAQGLQIKYVIETHLHADFVSGHQEIAARTGAQIVFGAQAGVEFEHRAVREGEEIRMGQVVMRFLETPGHTPEGICILVTDTSAPDEPPKLLTGDTLFIGDVGRPDLAGGKGYTSQVMAEMMYDSLHGKLLKLPDEVEVYPAHGAGSMCGRNMSKETSSTIGEQRKFNYALKPMSKDEFVQMMTADLPEAPSYFPKDAEINRSGARGLSELQPPRALTPQQVLESRDDAQGGHVLLDVRAATDFGAAHVPGSINIGLGGQFAMWAGSLIPLNSAIIIIADTSAQVDESVVRLARVGIENVAGYLEGGVQSWQDAGLPVDAIAQVSVSQLKEQMANSDLQIVDVRRPGEYVSGHVPSALNAPLASLDKSLNPLPLKKDKLTAVICAGGYRSSAAASLLQQKGFSNLLNVSGGTGAWINAGYPVESPSTD